MLLEFDVDAFDGVAVICHGAVIVWIGSIAVNRNQSKYTPTIQTRTKSEVESWLEIESTRAVALWQSRRLYKNLLSYKLLLRYIIPNTKECEQCPLVCYKLDVLFC